MVSKPVPFMSMSANDVDLPSLVLTRTRAALIQAVTHPITDQIDPKPVAELGLWLSKARWYLITDEASAKRQWIELAENVALVDLMVGLTARLSFQLHGLDLYTRTVEWVALSYSAMSKSQTVHEDLRKALAQPEAYKTLLLNNPWLLTVALLEFSGAVGALVAALNQPHTPR